MVKRSMGTVAVKSGGKGAAGTESGVAMQSAEWRGGRMRSVGGAESVKATAETWGEMTTG